MASEIQSEKVLRAVRALPMFRGLAERDQRRVAAVAEVREYTRGQALWEAGAAAEHLTVIVSGRVKVVGRSPDGNDVILEIFTEGEPVGAIAVYNYLPYPASAVAIERTNVLRVPRRDYFELLDRDPDFARAIILELTKLTIALTRKLEEMRGQRVDARIAQLFLTFATRMGRETPHGIEIPLQLTRQEIADMVGTTVETAIRVLSAWGREGVLVTGEGRFVAPDLRRLHAVADGAAHAAPLTATKAVRRSPAVPRAASTKVRGR